MPKGVYIHTKKQFFQKGNTLARGLKRSMETRKKMSLAKLGELNPMYGKTHPLEIRKRISEHLKGRRKPLRTTEHRKNLSLACKGRPVWNKGKHPDCVQGKNHPMYGKKYKKSTRIKLMESYIRQWHRKKPTSIETKLYAELKNKGLLFETQKLINGRFIVDAYIPSLNLIIEADGDYWHSLPKTANKDKAENAYLTKCGFNLLRLSETEINNGGFKNKLLP